MLAFARLHLDGGVTPDGSRLLGTETVAAMQQPQREIPSIGSHATRSAWPGG